MDRMVRLSGPPSGRKWTPPGNFSSSHFVSSLSESALRSASLQQSSVGFPDEGQIYINRALMSEPGGAAAPHQRGIGFAFQTTALWPHMTVAENILFGLHGLSKPAAAERLGELLSHINLEGFEDRYPAELSGGESRRVSLARTLAPGPKILLLDEPLTNVEPDLKKSLLDLVVGTVAQEGTTLLYVTHDQEEAAQVAGDNLTEMKAGRLGP